MRTASWVILTLVAVLVIFGSLASAALGYLGAAQDDVLATTNVAELAGGQPAVEAALRGRRGTAAAFGLGFAVLFLFVVLFPYRRGELWAWWALLFSTLCLSGLVLLRIPLIRSNLGAVTGGLLLVVVFIALILDIGRLSRPGR